MNVLVDSTVWSLLLRRPAGRLSETERALVRRCRTLAAAGRAFTTGIVRQEVLSGIRDPAMFDRVLTALRELPGIEPLASDHEEAARAFDRSRAAGVAATAVDVLLCALALREHVPILTADRDFERYAEVLGVVLDGTA